MDFSAICRTCIKSINNIDLNPIFLSEDNHETFSTAFYSCTGVQVKLNDGLPQNMCTACMIQYNNTLKFRKQCKLAETQLLKIKTELELKNTERQAILTNKKTDGQNFTSTKSELQSIKNEPLEIDLEGNECVKYLALKNRDILLLKSNNIKHCDGDEINTGDNSDDEFFNEDTITYTNEVNCKTETQHLQKDFKNENKTKQKSTKTLSDIELNISDTLSDTNMTYKKNIDIPYIITDTASKKTLRVVCKLCQKELSIRSIDSHMMRRHPGADERKVKCELCDKYVMKDKLNRHRVMMHGSVGVRCGYCKSEFNTKEALVDHVATCTAKNRKRKVNDSGRALAECDVCKMTMQRASLSKHKAVKHAGLRPVCEHCGKSFGNKFRLNEHYRAKHGYEKFQCRYCEFRSAGIMAMRNHERRHRGEKPFVCEACGAKFHAAYLLMQHKHSHKTEKLVKCDLCPASFKANNNLHMHKLTCHSKSYYSCAVCARSYKCHYYALKHARVAHGAADAPRLVTLTTQ
ncbi:hypothetical protein PYW07_013438 [Mythimna separata]|uniref:Uncharacterized protein n=1 Tax=Mythimna separata TaxID=271217 RepID=A0AAD7Y6L4_MYTSE|nr:hypothetical protein PYW07_013438 [Mythimna separata]